MVSDQGSHFKNKVVAQLNSMMHSKHEFTVAYSPWSNGTIEIIVKDMKKVCKSLLLEFKLKPSNVNSLLPLIQFALNHSPREDKANLAPITIFTGLRPSSNLDSLISPLTQGGFSRNPMTMEELQKMTKELQSSMDRMHKTVFDSVSTKREQNRKRRLNSRATRAINFGLGDYVLVALPERVHPKKMDIKWSGPYQIVSVVNDYVYEV